MTEHSGLGGESEELDDATVVVTPAGAVAPDGVDDATIAVRLDDATVVVPALDRTIVVAQQPRVEAGAPASDGPGAPASDEPGAVEPLRPEAAGVASHAQHDEARERAATVGAPVEERQEIPPELAKLLFKNPLDAKRRAPASPFPVDQSSLPRGGVRGGIPVVYGARGESFVAAPLGSDLARGLGAPPAGYELPAAVRESLPSLARLNRRFSALAWGGALVVPVVAGVGLWWVLTLLLRP